MCGGGPRGRAPHQVRWCVLVCVGGPGWYVLVCGIETCIKSGGGMRGCLGGGCVVCWRQVGIPGQQRGFIITLMVPIIKAHQFLVFTVPSSLQRAVAHGLEHEGAFYRCVCGGGGRCGVHRTHLAWRATHTNTTARGAVGCPPHCPSPFTTPLCPALFYPDVAITFT